MPSIALRFALKSDWRWIMLKMWVLERTTVADHPTDLKKQILTPCNDHQDFTMQFHCVVFNNKALIHLPMTVFIAVLHPNYQNLQKVGLDIVLFNRNVLGHAGHTRCKN